MFKWLRKLFNKQNQLVIKVKRVNSKAKLPTRAYSFDAGWDLYAIEDVRLAPGEQRDVKVGLAFEVPEGWHMQIHTRSSYGKKMLRCHLGIIDCGYRAELSIWIANYGTNYQQIKAGDKVCQVLFLPVPEVKLVEVDSLNPSQRGEKGHGSSGQ